MHGGPGGAIIGLATLFAVLIGPIGLWLVGRLRRSHSSLETHPARMDFALLVNSTAVYALAFNLTYFIQELFLVLPKALTPGLNPTLFHNNHTWEGPDPVAHLYQGTGAVAILVSGLAFALLLLTKPRGVFGLFALWMAYHGLMMGLPQIPSGVLAPSTDFGQAMTYLHLPLSVKLGLSLVALAAMVASALSLKRAVFGLAWRPDQIATPSSRAAFVTNMAVLPALIAIVVIAPFRMPTSLPNLLLPPVLIGLFGISWIYAGTWLGAAAQPRGEQKRISWIAIGALVLLLATFQLVLARGVHFY